MFKNKFKKTVKNWDLKKNNFEIISDKKATSILGGLANCGRLQSCGVFRGSCDSLGIGTGCGVFYAY